MSQHTYGTLDDYMEQYALGQIDRETYRRQLQGRITYYRKRHRKPGVLAKLHKALSELPVGGIAPDCTSALVAHCHTWHVVDTIPFTTPCCGVVLFSLHTEHSTDTPSPL